MTDVLMYFEKGGLVMYPLLVCSLIIIYIAIERYLFYKSIDSGALFTKQYCDILAGETVEKALEFAKSQHGFCANILTQATPLTTVERTEAFMEMKGGIAIARLHEKLSYLSVITTLAPLLGLLGTIVGMITTFSIFNIQAGQPMAITGGIGEALIATASGLCVAILSLCVHSYLSHKMNNIITNMEQCFSALSEAKVRGAGK